MSLALSTPSQGSYELLALVYSSSYTEDGRVDISVLRNYLTIAFLRGAEIKVAKRLTRVQLTEFKVSADPFNIFITLRLRNQKCTKSLGGIYFHSIYIFFIIEKYF